jgi:glycosidase
MNFVDNHDENSWNGTTKSRLAKAEEAMTALSYVMPGMPLIYSGNEYGLNHSLKFFEKDSIPKTKGAAWELRRKLGKLKTENSALNGGKKSASYKKIATPNDTEILAFEREKNGDKIIYIANLSDKTISISLPINGEFEDFITGKKIIFDAKLNTQLQPWQYYILN